MERPAFARCASYGGLGVRRSAEREGGSEMRDPGLRFAPSGLRTREPMPAAELFDLTGQVALVTGASSGLGVRFAQCLAENGAAVALVARRTDRLATVKAEIERAGGRAVAIEADVLDRAAIARAFDEAEAAFGTVTILV